MGTLERRLLYALATNDRLERLVAGSPRLRRQAYASARRYVAGETLDDAVTTVRALVAEGFGVSVDLFGEGLDDLARVGEVVNGYVDLARAMADIDGDVYLEVVPSHLGIDESVAFFCKQAEQVAAALPAGARLEVSAEESHRTPRIVDATLALADADVPVLATLQANLRRTVDDAGRLAEAGVPVRLVKGAYVEAPEAAHRWGEPTDVAYVRLAHQIHAAGVDLVLATHDPVIREALLPALEGATIEMLLGVRTADARDVLRRGHPTRIYVPYGQAWLRYWMRRVAERRGA